MQTVTTYPFEFVKTGRQLYRSFPKSTPSQFQVNSWREYFIGCNGLTIGNALKASSRFFVFNSSSKFMSNDNGKTTAPRVVVAGIMTGFVESLWVIPFENIKTVSIQNYFIKQHHMNYTRKTSPPSTNEMIKTAMNTSKSSTPKIPLRGNHHHKPHPTIHGVVEPATRFLQVVQEIHATRGFGGFWQGSLITCTRQVLNSAVWFSSFNAFKQLISPNHDLSPSSTVLVSLLSSVNVILLTQPIDVVKTRVQSSNFRTEYRDTMTCLVRTSMYEGMSKLWSGWLPRFIKVSVGGSITLYSYKAIETGLNMAMNEHPFQAE